MLSKTPSLNAVFHFFDHHKANAVAILRGDLERLDRYIVFILPLVFASFFLLPKSPQRNLIYVICLLPMLLYVRPRVFQAVRREAMWWLVMGLCGLWILSVAWSENLTHESLFDTLRIGLAVALFMHAGIWLALQGKLPQRRILAAILLTATAAGALALALAWLPGTGMSYGGRLTGFGWAAHPGIGGDIYAFAALIALIGMSATKDRRRAGLLFAALALCTFYVVLTESRGAVLAFVLAAFLYATVARPRHVLTLVGVLFFVGVAAAATGLVDFETWIARGSSYRIGIWADGLAKFAADPLLGLGAADMTRLNSGNVSFNSAHNIFIAMAVDLGVVGLVLFTALTALAAWRAWMLVRTGRGALLFTLLAFAYIVMLLHTQTILLMPAREWLIFWLPLLLLVQENAARTEVVIPSGDRSG